MWSLPQFQKVFRSLQHDTHLYGVGRRAGQDNQVKLAAGRVLPVEPGPGAELPGDGVEAEHGLVRVESVGEARPGGHPAHCRAHTDLLCNTEKRINFTIINYRDNLTWTGCYLRELIKILVLSNVLSSSIILYTA